MTFDAKSATSGYKQMMLELDPESSIEMDNLLAGGALVEPTPATFASWTKSAVGYAIQTNRLVIAANLNELHENALRETGIDDVGNEISGLYNCAFEFKNAEMNLEAVAKLAENTVDEESLPIVDNHIDRFGSVLRNAIIRAYGMLTSTAKDLKNKIINNLKDAARDFKSKLKDKFIDAFNKAAEFLFRLLNEFASKIFSFVDMIKVSGKIKGYGLKSVNIAFDPPTFDSIKIVGFSVPIPKVSLPKVEVVFEISSENKLSGIADGKERHSEELQQSIDEGTIAKGQSDDRWRYYEGVMNNLLSIADRSSNPEERLRNYNKFLQIHSIYEKIFGRKHINYTKVCCSVCQYSTQQ